MRNLKNKKIVIIILIILILSIFGVCGYTALCRMNPITVTEISMLQVNFSIESDTYMVVLPNEDENEQEGDNNNKSGTQNNSSSSSTTNKKSNSSSKKSSGTKTTVSNATYTPRIQIPRTKVNLVIYSDMSVKNMEKGVAILSSDNGLNQPGNTIISGHNYVNGRLFSNNHKIQEGDLIYVTDSSGQKITYSVYSKYYTTPNDANYMERDTGGAREISLTTCTPDSSQRIIVLAREI